MKNKSKGGLVYSTHPAYYEQVQQNQQENDTTNAASKQDLRVWLERKGGGKVATVVKGFEGNNLELAELGKIIKTKCGTGGTAKNGEIIIQGDFRDKIIAILLEMGHKAKKAGG
jgi:translation initiation factor 1